MRQALNSNPMVQIGVVAVLILVVGLMMMTNLKKGNKSSPASSSSDASALSSSGSSSSGSAPITTTPVTGSATAAAPATGATPSLVPSTGTVTPEAVVPGPGLPASVVKAWKSGDAVVLLVVRNGGVDDRLVGRSVRTLSGDKGLAVFVTQAKGVARYSRITEGVGVDRAPALVVVRPRQDTGSVPQAQVSYGFRNSQGVVQAVHDALYTGRDDLPYSPR